MVYPRPLTWGVNIHYNQWTGWGVNVGASRPHMSVGWPVAGGDHSGASWWGCGGVNKTTVNTLNLSTSTRPDERPLVRSCGRLPHFMYTNTNPSTLRVSVPLLSDPVAAPVAGLTSVMPAPLRV